jgi:hypothetical protein
LKAKIEIAHFGNMPLKQAKINWKILNKQGNEVYSGNLKTCDIAIGNCIELGEIEQSLSSIEAPGEFMLELKVNDYTNNWNFWVYPSEVPSIDTTNIYTCSIIDSKAIETLNSGGKVLVLASGKVENGKDVVQQFTPVFWNTSWFKMRPPHTTGILVQNNHPVFNYFPTDYFSNYQWYELVNRQQVMNLDAFPPNFKALVQPIDTWFLNRKLGLLFEANVGKGKVMVCSADLISKPEERIVARQLLYSISKYMNSGNFKPEYTLDLSLLTELFEIKERKGFDFYTKDSPDELKPDYKKPKK